MTKEAEAELEAQAVRIFGVDRATILESLLRSANARGYLLGSVSEVLLKRTLEERGYELERIKEKWVGKKLHHGDYYIRRRGGGDWYVLESKGLKSNAEKWHRIREVPTDPELLRRFFARRSRGELGRWWKALPAERKENVLASGRFPDSGILETHFVSGTGGKAGREIATPRKTEFHIVALDLYLRIGQHEFIFATVGDLESPKKYPEHLKQNYLVDIVVPGVDREPSIRPPWTRDFDAVFAKLVNPVREEDRQVDRRGLGEREAGVDLEEVDVNELEALAERVKD